MEIEAMDDKRKGETPRGDAPVASDLPDLRADHIPEDVLAEQDAEVHGLGPEHDALPYVAGIPDDVLAEEVTASLDTETGALTPTDDEVVDVPEAGFDRL
jgi:hypothetical protein